LRLRARARDPLGDRTDQALASLETDLQELATKSVSGPGVTRLAWSPEHLDACRWFAELMRGEELEVFRDPSGNVIGKLGTSQRPAVVIGSHLDTVPRGGAFDGSLGVLTGLCVARILADERDRLEYPLWVVAFMDEEGVRFGTSFFGSLAFAGEPLPSLARRDEAGTSLREAIRAAGLDPAAVSGGPEIDGVLAYLEAHIEQGPKLDESGIPLGVVTGIVGRRTFSVRLLGITNHAGTTPRSRRRDAVRGGAVATARLHDVFDSLADGTINVAAITAEPGAMNVISGKAELDVEIRASTVEALQTAEEALREVFGDVAHELDLGFDVELRESVDPVLFDTRLIELLERAAAGEGADCVRMPSGAGHDAMVIAGHVPVGMLLVPSRDGISHSEDEFTDARHCRLGAKVLAAAARDLAANGLPEKP
jgi:allantoate deiminase